jgi:hypothetical protein
MRRTTPRRVLRPSSSCHDEATQRLAKRMLLVFASPPDGAVNPAGTQPGVSQRVRNIPMGDGPALRRAGCFLEGCSTPKACCREGAPSESPD